MLIENHRSTKLAVPRRCLEMKVALTDVFVRAIEAPAQGQKTIWDKSRSLGVRAVGGGSKTYVVMVGSGQRKVIGRVSIISFAEVCGEAKRILAENTLGLTKKPSAVNIETAVAGVRVRGRGRVELADAGLDEGAGSFSEAGEPPEMLRCSSRRVRLAFTTTQQVRAGQSI
jgi:hypothetical protein